MGLLVVFAFAFAWEKRDLEQERIKYLKKKKNEKEYFNEVVKKKKSLMLCVLWSKVLK